MFGLLVMQAVAAVSPPAAEVRPITGPNWTRRPSAEDVERYYPSGAYRELLAATVSMSCTVEASGGLGDCQIVREEPAGRGFAEASFKLSKLFKMEATDRTGRSTVGGTVRIPIMFRPVTAAVANTVTVAAQGLEGSNAWIDCRVRAGVADNCLYVRGSRSEAEFQDLAKGVGPQVKFQPVVNGRFVIPIEFVSP